MELGCSYIVTGNVESSSLIIHISMETGPKWRLSEKYGGHTRSLYFGRHTRLGRFHSLNVRISGVHACFGVIPCILQQGGGTCDQLIRSNLGNLGRSADGRTVVYRSLDLEV